MNDHELTKKRQAILAKYGIQKGFPIHTVICKDDIKVFFTEDAARKYINSLSGFVVEHRLLYADDVREVSYKI